MPIYFDIPSSVTPGRGLDAHAGTVHVHVHPAIDTSAWRLDDVVQHKEAVRAMFMKWHRRP